MDQPAREGDEKREEHRRLFRSVAQCPDCQELSLSGQAPPHSPRRSHRRSSRTLIHGGRRDGSHRSAAKGRGGRVRSAALCASGQGGGSGAAPSLGWFWRRYASRTSSMGDILPVAGSRSASAPIHCTREAGRRACPSRGSTPPRRPDRTRPSGRTSAVMSGRRLKCRVVQVE